MSLFHRRTISLTGKQLPVSPFGTPYFLFTRLTGTESINGLFEYQVYAKSQDEYGQGIEQLIAASGHAPGSNLDLNPLIGSAVTLAIELDGKVDGIDSVWGLDIATAAGGVLQSALGKGLRYINGIVRAASYVGVEGRHAVYQFTVVPWFWLLTQTSDYRIFQHQSAIETIDTVLKKYPFSFETRYARNYEPKDYQVQYGETDFDFISRLMAENGINYFFEHQADRHTLILTDNLGGFKPMVSAAYQLLNVYPPDLKLQEEYVHTFNPQRTLTSGTQSLLDYQFKTPTANIGVTASNPWDTAHAEFELTEWHQGDYIDPVTGQPKVNIRIEEVRQYGHRAEAAGNLRGILAGHSFKLNNHPSSTANIGWIVLATELTAVETDTETRNPNGKNSFEVKVNFMVQPDTEQIRPERINAKPRAANQSATVVTPTGKEVWTDQHSRIKVQFHWDRLGTMNENSTCWLRVSSPWSGHNFGGIHIPRVGQEVVISFFDHDPDMPYISGRLVNPDHMPLWQLPSQYVLSGFKSKEIDGSQNNHLIMDDSTGEIQVQLTSDHQLSQLNMGYITRIPDIAGRSDYRGQGFELRTDGWGAIRAGKGMYVTSQGRTEGNNHILDMSEAVSHLKSAQSQHQSQGELAKDHNAEDLTAYTAIQTQNEQIAGNKDAKKDRELTSPHIVFHSPAGIQTATPQTTHIVANAHVAVTSGKDLSMSVGKSWLANVAKGISVFTASKGIKAFAAKDNVHIEAQSDNIEIIADKVMKLISATSKIEMAAAEEILLTAKGSYIRINGKGIEEGTPAQWISYAASHGLPGPRSLTPPMPNMPQHFSNKLDVYDIFLHEDFSKISYTAQFEDGRTQNGYLDEGGRTARFSSSKKGKVKILVGGKNWVYVASQAVFDPSKSKKIKIEDIFEQPVDNLKIEVRSGDKVIFTGVTNSSGEVNYSNPKNEMVTLYAQQFGVQEMTELFKIRPIVQELYLISPKLKYEIELLADDEAGDYWRGTYEVQEGDTLESIASKHGSSPEEILDINNFSMTLNPKDIIKIPVKSNRKS